ncbi:MAG: ATP-binding cassette domain-containing protein [Firmicutes bacterium]|nr:ATP-binding cassette domain-containing protein [Bacillota bacterium]
MLELRNIVKTYKTDAEEVHALKGVSINFRKNEFVSILGSSGCGKTTFLNIVGGLDHYTDGDLIIDGVSTKEYKDSDWDAYRNHSIGFVFQNYNLIPHQSVLSNVMLALTLSGESEEDAKQKAIDALTRVGLADQVNKKPNQMSGGQMQRVAIARALVNDPEILLADEPTGALDTETSVQIMEILKEIASDRLVIMVTHNPELAEKYSTRIIRLSDGLVIGDTNPYETADDKELKKESGLTNKSMSRKTALGLSLNNLMTKKARTLLTSFAGSIGIIGIALILSVSAGFQNYIDRIENDALTSYPLIIQSESADMTSMIAAFSEIGKKRANAKEGIIQEEQLMSQMFGNIGTNDLESFNTYLDKNMGKVKQDFNNISYNYGVIPQIYATDFKYGVIQVSPSTLMDSTMASVSSSMTTLSNTDIFFEITDNKELLDSQYKILAGEWPEKYNELVLVLDNESTMNDYIAYGIGLRAPDELIDMIAEVMKGNEVESVNKPLEWTYEELMDIEFSLVPAAARYKYNAGYGLWEDHSNDEAFMKKLITDGDKLRITAIVCPSDDNAAGSMNNGIGYIPALTKHVIEESYDADIVKAQLNNKNVDVFSGKTFEDLRRNNDPGLGFGDMISIDADQLSSALGVQISEDDMKAIITQYSEGIAGKITADSSKYENAMAGDLTALCTSVATELANAAEKRESGDLTFSAEDVDKAAAKVLSGEDYVKMMGELAELTGGELPADVFSQIFNPLVSGFGTVLKGMAGATMNETALKGAASSFANADQMKEAIKKSAQDITEAVMKKTILTDVGELSQEIIGKMAQAFNVDPAGIAAAFSFNMSEEELTNLMRAYMSGNQATSCDGNLRQLGYAEFDKPTAISFYLKDFEAKEDFIDFIENYNEKMKSNGDDDMVISYTDVTGVMLSSVKTITNSVSYVLIAFVAISLIVSSIMIGVITYISVLERTKEIGILRAIGASKKDISRVFNSEAVIIGFCAGAMGIIVSLLLLIPINAILLKLTGIASLRAKLPLVGGIALVLISVLLTSIAGLLPSKMAADKDPVEALRTE